jgi:hypothetical protein
MDQDQIDEAELEALKWRIDELARRIDELEWAALASVAASGAEMPE